MMVAGSVRLGSMLLNHAGSGYRFFMSNITAEIKGKNLVITIPFDARGTKSASGKTMVHASSRGNQEVKVKIDAKKSIDLMIGVNAYSYPND